MLLENKGLQFTLPELAGVMTVSTALLLEQTSAGLTSEVVPR